MRIASIVEGYGDVSAVPVLLRRILHDNQIYEFEIAQPFRAGDYWRVRRGFADLVRQLAKEGASILVLLDCDDGCPVEFRDELLSAVPGDIDSTIEVAFIVREFESMFLADEVTSKRELEIPEGVPFPVDPEVPRDAKGWLSRHMPYGMGYKETVHQEQLVARISLETLRITSRSFRHLETCLMRLSQQN